MNKPTRKLVFFAIIASCLSLAPAQEPEVPEIPRFTFCATAVGVDEVPELYWQDIRYDDLGNEIREPRRLSISLGSRGGTVEIPIRSPIKLYRRTQAADGSTIYEPAIDIPDQGEGDRILLLMYRKPDGSGTMQFVDDSVDLHPRGSVRFINVSGGKAVAAIGGAPQMIDPQSSKLLGRPNLDSERRFTFDVAANVPGLPTYRDPTKRLRLRSPEHRLLVLFTFLAKYEMTEATGPEDIPQVVLVGYTPLAYRLYDRIPFPEPEEDADAEE